MGFLLTSTFFFFGMRQRANIRVQRDTEEILNARMYMESLADYYESQADSLTDPTNVDFDEIITGTVTKKVDRIEGAADVGPTGAVTYEFGGSIFVEWNKCSNNMKGDLVVNNVTYEHDEVAECNAAEEGYDDVIGPITVPDPFTVKTLNAPFYFEIAGNNLKDNEWHLELNADLGYGRDIKTERTF